MFSEIAVCKIFLGNLKMLMIPLECLVYGV
jgi:hypothetical protein